MRFGLIGYGLWGKRHAVGIDKLDTADLVAIACKSEATAAEAAADYPNAHIYRDYRDLLARDDIEAVSIVLPNYLHAEVGVAALESGKDVLLEKPMATTVEECDRLIAAAKANNKVLSIGHEFRISRQWAGVKDIIDAGDIGTPMHTRVNLFRFPFRHTSENWRYRDDMVGLWILEEPVHFFDQVLWYMEACGDPTSVSAWANNKGREPGLYDNFSAVVSFPNGAYAIVAQTLGGFEHHIVVDVIGTEGAIRTTWSGIMDRTTEPMFELKVQRKGQDSAETVDIGDVSGEAFEVEEQIRLTVEAFHERRPLVSPESSRKAVHLCVEAARSVAEGGEVTL